MKKRNLLIIVLGVITTLKLLAYDFVFVNGGYIDNMQCHPVCKNVDLASKC